VLRDGKLVDELWHKVVVGDVIKMENDQFVAVSSTMNDFNAIKIAIFVIIVPTASSVNARHSWSAELQP